MLPQALEQSADFLMAEAALQQKALPGGQIPGRLRQAVAVFPGIGLLDQIVPVAVPQLRCHPQPLQIMADPQTAVAASGFVADIGFGEAGIALQTTLGQVGKDFIDEVSGKPRGGQFAAQFITGMFTAGQ